MNIVLDFPTAHLPAAALPVSPIFEIERSKAVVGPALMELRKRHGGFFKVTYVNGMVDFYWGDDLRLADLTARVAA